jgi:hypothetical protein
MQRKLLEFKTRVQHSIAQFLVEDRQEYSLSALEKEHITGFVAEYIDDYHITTFPEKFKTLFKRFPDFKLFFITPLGSSVDKPWLNIFLENETLTLDTLLFFRSLGSYDYEESPATSISATSNQVFIKQANASAVKLYTGAVMGNGEEFPMPKLSKKYFIANFYSEFDFFFSLVKEAYRIENDELLSLQLHIEKPNIMLYLETERGKSCPLGELSIPDLA